MKLRRFLRYELNLLLACSTALSAGRERAMWSCGLTTARSDGGLVVDDAGAQPGLTQRTERQHQQWPHGIAADLTRKSHA